MRKFFWDPLEECVLLVLCSFTWEALALNILCCSCHFAYRSIDDSDALGVHTGIHVRLIHGSVTEPIWVFDNQFVWQYKPHWSVS